MSDPAIGAGAAAVTHALSPIELFVQADSVVKTVIVLLLLSSTWGWGVIAEKLVRVSLLRRRAATLIDGIRRDLPVTELAPAFSTVPAHDPLAQVYKAVIEEYQRSADLVASEAQRDALTERIHRVASLVSSSAIDQLQHRLPALATIGAVAPFVGLFGTVWGIMNSFQGIAASNNTSLAIVAPGIAEALFATALGLVAAIPAVIFYNRISGDIGAYGKQLTTFVNLFEVELSRQLSREGEGRSLHVA